MFSLGTATVLALSLPDTLLKRLRLVHLGSSQTVTVGGRRIVRVAHAIRDRALVRRSGAVQLVATTVSLSAAELLVVTTGGREAVSLTG